MKVTGTTRSDGGGMSVVPDLHLERDGHEPPGDGGSGPTSAAICGTSRETLTAHARGLDSGEEDRPPAIIGRGEHVCASASPLH